MNFFLKKSIKYIYISYKFQCYYSIVKFILIQKAI